MRELDPKAILDVIARDLPADLCEGVYLAGSLAAALALGDRPAGRSIRTKDADFVVQSVAGPAVLVRAVRRLKKAGWTYFPTADFPAPGRKSDLLHELPFIRLAPAVSAPEYFVEFLGSPRIGEPDAKRLERIQVGGEHYAVPVFRFMGLTSWGLRESPDGWRHSDPSMMALANLLSHSAVGSQVMETPIGGRKRLRSAKDLGRVLAIARLVPREQHEKWIDPWLAALRAWFPADWRSLGGRIGDGLRDLLSHEQGLEDAHFTATFTFLAGMGFTKANLSAVAEQLLADVLDPFAEQCRKP